jgi:hypothetical protein
MTASVSLIIAIDLPGVAPVKAKAWIDLGSIPSFTFRANTGFSNKE